MTNSLSEDVSKRMPDNANKRAQASADKINKDTASASHDRFRKFMDRLRNL